VKLSIWFNFASFLLPQLGLKAQKGDSIYIPSSSHITLLVNKSFRETLNFILCLTLFY